MTTREQYVQRLYEDFPFFVSEVWRDRKLDKLAPLSDVELELAQLAAVGPKRRGILAPRGVGKALALDTPIPTPDGWTTMGAIEVGDTVFDERGRQCRVTFTTDIMHGRDCYEVSFSDGARIIADAEHQWTVHDRWASANPKTITTEEMKDRVVLTSSRGWEERRYSVPVADSLECGATLLPIDPYILGVWLGDGSSWFNKVYHHIEDQDHFRREAESAGYGFTPNDCDTNGNTRGATINGLSPQLRASGLYQNKHIPREYLRAPEIDRMALLQGLVDTDGHISKKSGRCEFTTTKRQLADGFLELARSLGFKVSFGEYRATIDGRDCGPKYRISFQPHADRPVARLQRKIDAHKARPSTYSISDRRTIISIDPVDSVPVRCIQVDSPSHLYLAGEHMVPTHNTMVVTATLSCWRYFRDPDRRILILSKSEKEAKKTVFIIRQWLDHIHFLGHLKPRREQRDGANYFDVGPSRDNRQPSMFCVGVGGQTEGNRAHTIIVDDGETKNNTKTAESRDELERLCSECINILYPDVPREDGGPVDPVEVIYVGTLKHEDSLYPRLAAKGYHFTSYPLAYPNPSQELINLSPLLQSRLDSGDALPGEPVFPKRFNHDNLAEKMAEGAREWALEHMLQANYGAQQLYPLRLEDLIVMPSIHRDIAPTFLAWGKADHSGSTRLQIPHMGHPGDDLYRPFSISRETAPYLGTKVWIDPAGRGEDETAFGAGSSLNGFLWIKDVQSIPGGHTREDMETMILFGRRHNATEFYIESNADTLGTYRTLFESVLRQFYLEPGDDPLFPDGWKAALIDDPKITHATGQKELRILGALEPLMAAHRLVVAESTIRLNDTTEPHLELQHQLTRLTRDRNSLRQDGKLDVLTGLARAWNYTLRTSPEDSLLNTELRRIQQANDQFQSFIKGIRRQQPKPPRFIQPR